MKISTPKAQNRMVDADIVSGTKPDSTSRKVTPVQTRSSQEHNPVLKHVISGRRPPALARSTGRPSESQSQEFRKVQTCDVPAFTSIEQEHFKVSFNDKKYDVLAPEAITRGLLAEPIVVYRGIRISSKDMPAFMEKLKIDTLLANYWRTQENQNAQSVPNCNIKQYQNMTEDCSPFLGTSWIKKKAEPYSGIHRHNGSCNVILTINLDPDINTAFVLAKDKRNWREREVAVFGGIYPDQIAEIEIFKNGKCFFRHQTPRQPVEGISIPPTITSESLGETTGESRTVIGSMPKIRKENLKTSSIDLQEKQEEQIPAKNFLVKRITVSQGTNPGGFYRGSDVNGASVIRYIKIYQDHLQADCEELASKIYRRLGIGASLCRTFQHDGNRYFSSRQIQNVRTWREFDLLKSDPDKKKIAAIEFLHGFLADVLMKNWDTAGAGSENVLVGKNSEIHRIDHGGSFLMRGLNGRKPESQLYEIDELEKFFDLSINPSYATIASFAGIHSAVDVPDLRRQMDAVVGLRDAHGGWAAFIQEFCQNSFANGEGRKKIAVMLETRTEKLQKWVNDILLDNV